jgi:hypothetical protein
VRHRTIRIAPRLLNVSLLALCTSCASGTPTVTKRNSEPSIVVDSGSSNIEDVVTIDSGCVNETSRGKLRPSNILFVIDRSGSMSCNLPENGQSTKQCAEFPAPLDKNIPSKWELTRKAVESAVSELRNAGTVRLGLSLFPKTGSLCTATAEPEVPIANLDAAQQERIAKALDSLSPSGETPLAGATILAYSHLLERMRAGNFDGESFVILVTDGYETCKSDEIPKLLNKDVPSARAALGVRTFVIGAPGSEQGRSLLSQIAVAGETETSVDCTFGPDESQGNCHYDMTNSLDFAADLLDALTKVNAEVLACNLDIPSGPEVNLEEVNVLIDGKSWPMITKGACSKANGWRYTSDYSAIQLCGDACRAAKTRGAEATVILGCRTLLQ